MLALSVQQPFATLIMQGMKRWECRTWSAQLEALRQEDPHWPRFAIHASRQTTMNNLEVWRWLKLRGFLTDCKTFFDLPTGCIIGIVQCGMVVQHPAHTDIMTELDRATGEVRPGMYYWLLEEPDPWKEPLRCSGDKGFWEMARLGTEWQTKRSLNVHHHFEKNRDQFDLDVRRNYCVR